MALAFVGKVAHKNDRYTEKGIVTRHHNHLSGRELLIAEITSMCPHGDDNRHVDCCAFRSLLFLSFFLAACLIIPSELTLANPRLTLGASPKLRDDTDDLRETFTNKMCLSRMERKVSLMQCRPATKSSSNSPCCRHMFAIKIIGKSLLNERRNI